MHQQLRITPDVPNSAARSAQRSDVTGRTAIAVTSGPSLARSTEPAASLAHLQRALLCIGDQVERELVVLDRLAEAELLAVEGDRGGAIAVGRDAELGGQAREHQRREAEGAVLQPSLDARR